MTSALEEIKTIDIEEWLTLATAPSPTKLKQGQSPDMKNVWTDEKPGSVITSKGYVKVGQIPSNNPVTFCINYFKTSSGVQTFVVSDGATVWTTIDFQNFTSIIVGLASSFQLRGLVIRDKLWLTNGSDAVRTFDGTTVTVLDGTVGTPNVPRGRYIAYHDERVWLYHVSSARSAVYFSSLTDSTGAIIAPDNVNAWDTTDNFLQISEGDADFGTGLLLYRGYLFLFKQYSVWRLVGYDEYTYSRVKTRASTGTRFNESVQILDSLVHLIGVDGIYVFDGEETERISDIIDPGTASQTSFGFDDIQQPNTNAQFWETQDTSDWNAGTVPADLSIDDSATLIAADDSQSDFQAGPTQTNLDLLTLPGSILLSRTTSGVSGINVASNKIATMSAPLTSIIGVPGFVTDGNLTNKFGAGARTGGYIFTLTIAFGTNYKVSRIILRGTIRGGSNFYQISFSDGASSLIPTSINNGGSLPLPGFPPITVPPGGPTDYTINFTPHDVTTLTMTLNGNDQDTFTEIEVYATAFNATGKFTSKTLDLGEAPASLGNFNAIETLNGEGTAYFTQSSADGSSWDAETSVVNGGAIASTPRRYLRWGVNLTSDGANTPQIDAAFLPAVYLSAIHNTGGSIFAWGPFESDYNLNGQVVNFYYRTATTSGGIPGTTWKLIVPGGVISDPITNQYVQFKLEFLGGTASSLPVVDSVTINWITGSGGQPQTLQNVASVAWRNRYWLAAASAGATANDIILVRGKKTFQSPWMFKDWGILSFARFFDALYGGSSVDGSILQLDSGYSKAGVAMDSYFETGDFVFGGFTANLIEILVEVERTGTWNLSVGVSLDGGLTFEEKTIDLTPGTYDTNFIKRLNFSFTTTRFRLRFRTNGIDTPFQVHRCAVLYKLNPERGSIRGDYITS